MKTLFTISLLCLIAYTALAQEPGDYGGIMGLYFSDTEFSSSTANIDTGAAPFSMYLVLLDGQIETLAAYEAQFSFTSEEVFILDATGPNGWTNFGSITDHMAGYMTPLPLAASGSVISTMTLLYPGTDQVDIFLGGSTLESLPGWDGPVIVAPGPDQPLLACDLSSGASGTTDVVAWLNRVPVAVENHSLSEVKSLFE